MSRVLWSQRQDVGPSPRMHHAIAYDAARQRVVLFGGDALGSTFLADTWQWDGEYWTQVGDTGPSARSGHRLTFDSNASAVVLFGGSSADGLRGDTWQWNGTDWTQVADTGPAPRTAHGLAYDGARSRVVLFGGEVAASALQRDTWEWDGAEWTQVEDVGPAPRRHHAMAFDDGRSRTLVFGGDTGSGSSADTWEWDGATWTQVADMGPAACAAASAAFDGSAVLLFGGVDSLAATALAPKVSGLTWEWDGELWTLRQDMGPRARWGHAVAFDANRGKAVLFGGLPVAPATTAAASDVLGDTWEAAPPASAAPVEIASFQFDPDSVPVGGATEIIIGLAQPAPAGGALVGIAQVGMTEPLVTIAIAPGATTGQTPFPVPAEAAPGDYEFEARVGASVQTATIHITAIAPTLMSFTLIPDTVDDEAGGQVTMEVSLDQPASGSVTVQVWSGGSLVQDITVLAGSAAAAEVLVVQPGTPVNDYALDAVLGGAVITALLHVV